GSTGRSASATTALPSADVLRRPSADAGKTTPSGASVSIRLPVSTARAPCAAAKRRPPRPRRYGDSATAVGTAESPRAVNGPSTSPRFLPRLNLGIHPVVVGEGRRIFDSALPRPLRFVAAAPTPTGVVTLTYAPYGARGSSAAAVRTVSG